MATSSLREAERIEASSISSLWDRVPFSRRIDSTRFCPSRVQNKLDIAVEEFFTNICCYAYKSAGPEVPRTVLVQRTYSADPPSITVDLIDRGVEFDPLKKPDAVTPKRIEDVPIGGLGILMAKKSVDEISYERSDGRNILTIVKRW